MRAVAVLAAALLVAGCPAAQQAAPAPAETKPMVTVEPAPTPPETAVVIVAPPAEPAAVARLPEAEPIDDDPAQLMALDGAALEALLGPPGLLREEPPAEVWLYEGTGCALHVFLYPERDGAPYRVTYYEMRGEGGGIAAERRCLRGLIAAKRGDAS